MNTAAHDAGEMEVFTFGDPEPIDRLRLLDYAEAMFNGKWYEPPYPQEGHQKLMMYCMVTNIT